MYPNQPATKFFDAGRCPGCAAAIIGGGPNFHCPACGLPLSTPRATELAGLLIAADRTLAALRQQQYELNRQPAQSSPPPAAGWFEPAATPPGPAGVAGSTGPAYASRSATEWPATRRTSQLSGAAILLGLGGLCLVVAAIVFLSVSWTSLSLGAKVAVLAAVTGLLAAAAIGTTRRGLRGSTETLWAIALADLALDGWTARRAGLAGSHLLSAGLYTAAVAGVITALALLCCRATRRSPLGQPVISAQVIAAAAGFIAVTGGAGSGVSATWLALSLMVLAMLGLAVVGRAGRFPVTARIATVGAALPWAVLAIIGLVQVGNREFVPQLWHGRACELPAAAVLAIAAAAVPQLLRRAWARQLAALAAGALTAIGLGAAAEHYLPVPLALAVVTAALAGTATASRRGAAGSLWQPASARLLLAGLGVAGIALTGAVGTGLAASMNPAGRLWQRPATERLAHLQQVPAGPWLVLLLVTAAAVLSSQPTLRSPVLWTLGLSLLTAAAIVLNARPSVLVTGLVWLVAAALTTGLAVRDRQPALRLLPVAALAIGFASTLPSDLASLVTFGGGALLTVLAGWRWLPAATEASVSLQPRALIELAAIGQLFVAAAAGWHRVDPSQGAPAVAGLLVCAAVLGAGASTSTGRRWWCWPALTAVTGAIWIEAAVHRLHAPEPYSVPAGLLALAFGIQAARRSPARSSWLTVSPGLLVLSLPSLLPALAAPLSGRAAMLGLLALTVTLTSARYRWQAPLLIGAAELALLAVAEIGPYALALPRWISIGAVGLLLLAIGISWEGRLADLRQAQRRLAGMR